VALQGYAPLAARRSPRTTSSIIPHLPEAIRFSETFNVPLSELIREVRRHQLEGIVAKRAGSHYRSGERSTDWLKWRANRGQEFVIDGYIPNGDALDSILMGYSTSPFGERAHTIKKGLGDAL
jgi:bifunctional non-homologous end joining protein LigD